MENWHCFKCKVPMIEVEAEMSYLEIANTAEGIKCPSCGTTYLTEETVMERVREAEELLETK